MKKILLIVGVLLAINLNAQDFFASKPDTKTKLKFGLNRIFMGKLADSKKDDLILDKYWLLYKADFNTGKKEFKTTKVFPKGIRNNFCCISDLNGDGLNDIIYAGCPNTKKPTSGIGGYMLADKDGKYSAPVNLDAGLTGEGNYVAIGDIDGDKIKDIVISVRKKGLVMFSGGKNFKATILDSDARGGFVAIADFDNDGENELFHTAFNCNHRIYKFEDGKVKEFWKSKYKNESPATVLVADVDEDNKVDLLIGGRGFWDSPKLQIYLSSKCQGKYNDKADVRFSPSKSEKTDILSTILLDDLDNDGKKEIILSFSGNAKSNFGGKTFFLTNQFQLNTKQAIIVSGSVIALFDVNGDGEKDLITNNPYSARLKKLGFDNRDINIFLHK